MSINYTNLLSRLATFVTSSSLTSALASDSSRPWAAGYILASGAVQTSFGQQSISVAHTAGSQTYTISWGAANPQGVFYGVLISPRAGTPNVTVNYAGTTTRFVAYTISGGTTAAVPLISFSTP